MGCKHWLLFVLVGGLWLGSPGRGDEPNTADDERLLKEARLPSDAPALLDFFRKRTLSDPDRDKIKLLIGQLGNDAFAVREKASAELVIQGAAAVPFLQQVLKDTDIEVVRRAEACLRLIEKGALSPLIPAAVRVVAARKPAGAVEVLLAYLPFADTDAVAEEIRHALAGMAVRDGRPEMALIKGLASKSALLRGAAAEALIRGADAGQRSAARKLLHDPDPEVRLRVALGLAQAREKEAVPVLIAVLAELPADRLWVVEDMLFRLAGDQGPAAPLGDGPETRRACRDAWAAWWARNADTIDLGKLEVPRPLGYSLIVLLDANRIMELDANNKPRWQVDGVQFPLDVQLLGAGRLLVAEHQAGRVTERDLKGNVVWEKPIEGPLVAQRLPNGNTFIATRNQLLEVDPKGKERILHTCTPGEVLMKAQKLQNGQIACVKLVQQARFVRLDAAGTELFTFPVDVRTSGGRIDVLPNGHVLVPELANNRIVECNSQGKVVWEVKVEQPIAALRLPNGNTLATSMSQNRAVELTRAGREVWEYKTDTRVTRAFRR